MCSCWRNSEHFGEDSLKNPPDGNSFHKTGSESYDASQPEELKMVNIEMAHGNQYAFPPSTPDYTFDNAQHLNAAFAQSQTNSQMQNLSSFSNVMVKIDIFSFVQVLRLIALYLKVILPE